MTETVISRIGIGLDYATLADWARALPTDLRAADTRQIAEVSAAMEDPGGVVIETACDATRFVEIRAADGEGHRDLFDPVTDRLVPTPGLGAMIRAARGSALHVRGEMTAVRIIGLQIVAEEGAAISSPPGLLPNVTIEHCLIEANSAAPAAGIGGDRARVSHCTLIQRGAGDGVLLENGASTVNTLVIRPDCERPHGCGIAAQGSTCRVRATAVFGFQRAIEPEGIEAAGLMTDQINLIHAPDNFAHFSWRAAGATVERNEVLPGPAGTVLQWLGNDRNAFARFRTADEFLLEAGRDFSLSMIIAQATALRSALIFEAESSGAEMVVDWTTQQPTVRTTSNVPGLEVTEGRISALGSNSWHLRLKVRSHRHEPIGLTPAVSVAHGVQNIGLSVGFYAGAVMAGPGHLGHGFARTTPHCARGTDPEDAVMQPDPLALDLRPVPDGPLETLWSMARPAQPLPCHEEEEMHR